jgi:hypothetical protein
MKLVYEFVHSNNPPLKVIFFGSILTQEFDNCSDIDLICLYPSVSEADLARRRLYSIPQPTIGHPLEILCVDEETFKIKSERGGVYMIARESGKSF